MNPTVKTAFGIARGMGMPKRKFACELLAIVNGFNGHKKKCNKSWENTVYRWGHERPCGGYTWPIYDHLEALKYWINTNR